MSKKTVLGSTSTPSPVPVLRVRLADGRSFSFSEPFYVGRERSCEVQIQDVHVSRRHVVVSVANGQWSITDLQSSNGVIVDGQRVTTVALQGNQTIRLGADGPTLEMALEAPAPAVEAPPPAEEAPAGETMMLAGLAERYFGSTEGEEQVGPRTMMIRRAFEKVHKKQQRKYRWIVAAV